MADKTVVVTLELRVTAPGGEAELLAAVLKDRNSTSYTENESIWEYSPKEKLVSVEVE